MSFILCSSCSVFARLTAAGLADANTPSSPPYRQPVRQQAAHLSHLHTHVTRLMTACATGRRLNPRFVSFHSSK